VRTADDSGQRHSAAKVRFIVWWRDCAHQFELNPAEQAARFGAETTVPDWQARLVCSHCGSRAVNMVVTGTEQRPARPTLGI
jgi:hypothetical protein